MDNRQYDQPPDSSGYLETNDQLEEQETARPTRKVLSVIIAY